ncbi:hypothetical protein GCM10009555_007340 [Acrocarpospora macrocephala]|uniref:Uncharacterized protein n=1 Tax=Acrocarpospora macrocephala TaxID=150177 RepID=A0A5M3X0Q9_9ACTN|nr:hypothetical protein Amac_067980 [Acrocarpospora macrocephala]
MQLFDEVLLAFDRRYENGVGQVETLRDGHRVPADEPVRGVEIAKQGATLIDAYAEEKTGEIRDIVRP